MAIGNGNGERRSNEHAEKGDAGDLNHGDTWFVVKSVVEIERLAINAVRGTVDVWVHGWGETS